MKNYEKYAEQIREYKGSDFCGDFIIQHILKSQGCRDTNCMACRMLQMAWLLEEYEEPEVDWSKVKVDTPILVRYDEESVVWHKKHFAKYEDGKVCAWNNGETSWTTNGGMTAWKYVKLADSEEGGAE